MVAQAQAATAPRMTRAAAAAALGADLARLERALAGDAEPDADAAGTGSGLREDQAAAALSVLTDGRRVSVINAPAGAGKTRVLAEIAKAWREAGLGPVIGITASQSARNTLAAGGIESYNSARFLGHLPGQRGARGHLPIAEGTLLAVDEASMMTNPGPGRPDRPWPSGTAARSSSRATPSSSRPYRTAAACPCSPTASATSGWRNRCGSAPAGNARPACGCATATPPSPTSTTGTPGSPAATRN